MSYFLMLLSQRLGCFTLRPSSNSLVLIREFGGRVFFSFISWPGSTDLGSVHPRRVISEQH